MKRISTLSLLTVLLCAAILGGCGGGGGSEQTIPPTAATLTFSTSGTLLLDTAISGAGITITLPAGVTVKTDSNGNVDPSVVNPAGVTAGKSTVIADYTPVAGSSPAKLSFVVTSTAAAGFGVGGFATVNLGLTNGSSPQATDFILAEFKPVDLNGVAIAGLSAAFTVIVN